MKTNGVSRKIAIAPKQPDYGSSVNGGELLAPAIATCFCNDLYREAAKRWIDVRSVRPHRGGVRRKGEPARGITYGAKIGSDASDKQISDLLRHIDTVAEIHNTLRSCTPATFCSTEFR